MYKQITHLVLLNKSLVLLFFILGICEQALFAQAVDPNFYPIISKGRGIIYSSLIQPDKKILIAGSFPAANGEDQVGLARLNVDGSLDRAFSVKVQSGDGPGTVYDMKLVADNKILFVGNFQSVNGQSRQGLARINSDGSLDPTLPNIVFNNPFVNSVGLQSDGKMIVGGAFITVNGQNHLGIVRINTDGSIDSSFTTTLSSSVNSVSVQPDNKIVIGGRFTAVQLTARGKIARLNADGSLDSTFLNGMSGASDDVNFVRLQSDGKVLLSGFFNSVNGAARNKIARLNTDGTVDTGFQNGLSGVDREAIFIAQLPNGKIIVSGTFSTVNGVTRDKVARLNSDGSTDASFAGPQFYENPPPAFESLAPSINSVSFTAENDLIVAGSFQQVDGILRQHVTRIREDGLLDPNFNYVNLEMQGVVTKMARQSDGKIVIAGDFALVNGVQSYNLARLNTDGTLDPSFVSPFRSNQSFFDQIQVLPDGKILIAGKFDVGSPLVSLTIARFNPNGTLDTTFEANISFGPVHTFSVQPDGKIFIGGDFQSVNGQSRNNIARLNPNGSLDTSFQSGMSGANNTVISSAIQPDGRVIFGGTFSTVNGVARRGLARLLTNGSLDTSFVSNSSSLIRDIELQPDGQILVAEVQEIIDPPSPNGVVRLNSDGSTNSTFQLPYHSEVLDLARRPNGEIVFVGNFDVVNGSPRRIVRLASDLTFDSSFPSYTIRYPSNPHLESIVVAPNGNLFFGGTVDKVNEKPRSGLFRIKFNCPPSDFDGDSKSDLAVWRESNGIWFVNSSGTPVAPSQFGQPGDKIVPGDFDGDGKADLAVYRPAGGLWYLKQSAAGFSVTQWGVSTDVPVSGDFDGDGKADIAVWRPSTGVWFVRNSGNGQTVATQYGQDGDRLVPGDYDGDGKTDLAVWRQASGIWFIRKSSGGETAVQFGQPTDKVVPADYDGDGKTDLAVYREGNLSLWYIFPSTAFAYTVTQWGTTDDVPVPGDYDGDGKTDISVWRPSNGIWFMQRSTSGFLATQFGQVGDKPIPAAYLPLQ